MEDAAVGAPKGVSEALMDRQYYSKGGLTGVSNRTYTLVDGEFLRGLLNEYSAEIGLDLWSRFSWSDFARSDRTFFYDSLPAKKENQDEDAWRAEVESRHAEYNAIGKTENVFVKYGENKFRRRYGRQQKGVDILLAVDAVNFALRDIADVINIYTSDLDFFPVFEALQTTGCRGRLFHHPSKVSEELILCADSAQPLLIDWVLDMCGLSWGRANGVFSSRTANPRLSGMTHELGVGQSGQAIRVTVGGSPRHIELEYYVNGKTEYFYTQKPLLIIALCQKFMADYSAETDKKIRRLFEG